MNVIIAFFIGLIVGCVIGILIMALCQIQKAD